jgi:hypothetical protein
LQLVLVANFVRRAVVGSMNIAVAMVHKRKNIIGSGRAAAISCPMSQAFQTAARSPTVAALAATDVPAQQLGPKICACALNSRCLPHRVSSSQDLLRPRPELARG